MANPAKWMENLAKLGINPPKDQPQTQTLHLPGGYSMQYETHWDQERFINEYKAIRQRALDAGYNEFPDIGQGGPVSDRALLSGASQRSKTETLKQRHPWQSTVYLGDNREPLELFAGEDGKVFTMEEPGLAIGDVADALKPIMQVGAETASTAITPGPAKGAALIPRLLNWGTRATVPSGVGALTGAGYDAVTEGLGRVDERPTGERAKQYLTEFALGTGLEAGLGMAVPSLVGGAKKAGRFGGKREAMGENLAEYRGTFDEDPKLMSTIAGKGSRAETAENYIEQYFPGTGGQQIADAKGEVAGVIDRRKNEVIEMSSKGDAAGAPGSPYEAGLQTREGIYGTQPEFGRVNERVGGWHEEALAHKSALMDDMNSKFPLDTRISDLPPDQGVFGELGTVDAPGPGPGGTRVVPSAVMPGQAQPGALRASQHPLLGMDEVAPPMRPVPAPEAPQTRPKADRGDPFTSPLREMVSDVRTKPGGQSPELDTIQEVLENPDATLRDLLGIKDMIGKSGRNLPGVSSGDQAALYGAVSQTIEDAALRQGPEALQSVRAFNAFSEQYYDLAQGRLKSIFKDGQYKDVDPEVAFNRIYNATKGVGNRDKLLDVFNTLQPDDSEFLQRALLSRFWNDGTEKAVFKRWKEMPAETKDALAPPGSYWRTQYDKITGTAESLELLDRSEGLASTLSKASAAKVIPPFSVLGAAGLAVHSMATGSLPGLAEAGTAAAITAGAATVAAMTQSLQAAGKSHLLRSPAFFDWVTSVSTSQPRNIADGTADALLSFYPRLSVDEKSMSFQDLRDMQELQKEYDELLAGYAEAEAQGAKKNENGILGPKARPPAEPDGLFSTRFTETVGR